MKTCTKRRYRDAIEAKLLLAKIRHRDNPARPRIETRAYYHAVCNGWHLTSMPRGH